MFQEANDQLENIDPFNRAAPEVLAVRIAVYQGLKKWEVIAASWEKSKTLKAIYRKRLKLIRLGDCRRWTMKI